MYILFLFSIANDVIWLLYTLQFSTQLPTNHTHLGERWNAWSRTASGATCYCASERNIRAQDAAKGCIQLQEVLDSNCSRRKEKAEAF